MKHLLLVVLMSFMASSVAVAQEGNPQKAKEAFQAAKAAHEKGDFRESIRRLKEAYSHYPDPVIRLSIAKRWMDLDEPEEAIAELTQIKAKSRRVQKLVEAEIKRVREALELPVVVNIKTEPKGAMVRFGLEAFKKAPIKRSMKRGVVTLTVRQKGYKPFKDSLLIKGTKPLQRTFKLSPIVSKLRIVLVGLNEQAKKQGKTTVVTLDGKKVSLDKLITVKPGKHVVTCGYDGELANTTRVKVPPGKTFKLKCKLPDYAGATIDWRMPTAWTAVGTGAAATIAGITMFIVHAVDTSKYSEPRYTVESSSMPLMGGVSTAVGAGLVGYGTYLLLTE